MRTILCGLVAVACAACADPIYVEPDVEPTKVVSAFHVSIDPSAPSLASGATLEPNAAPVIVEGEAGELTLHVFVKRAPNRADVLWVELLAENHLDVAIGTVDVEITNIGGTGELYDLGTDPFSGPIASRSLPLGGIAPHGVSRLMIGVSATPIASQFDVTVTGTTTRRQATSSTPIAITPDGAEVWSVVPDAEVAELDLTSDEVAALVEYLRSR